MKLTGRLSGLFLLRVFLLLVALGGVFTVWVVGFSVMTLRMNRSMVSPGPTPVTVLEAAETDTTVSTEGSVTVGGAALAEVDALDGWLQVLDAGGREVYAYAKPSEVPTYYPAGRLVYLRNNPDEIGQGSLFTWFSTDAGELTWVLGTAEDYRTPLERSIPGVSWVLQAFLVLLAAAASVTLMIAWASGRTLARPLEHMMDWIEGLARGDFFEPLDRKGIPASKQVDGRLRRPYRTYREVVGALDKLSGRLGRTEHERERLEQTRDEWVTGVSHDLRTPLSSVRGYATLLESDYQLSAEEVRHYGHIIGEQSANMERLIEDLSLTFRLKTDALPLTPVRVDLVELAREAAIDLANDPRSAGREVIFEPASATLELLALLDPVYFSRALGNLLTNAVIHNPAGTAITLSVCEENGYACVDVRDDGVGMDAQTASRLFDRYYRGTAASADASGTGLGMAIAKQLVEAGSGTIAVASEPSVGTVVRVCVPIIPAS